MSNRTMRSASLLLSALLVLPLVAAFANAASPAPKSPATPAKRVHAQVRRTADQDSLATQAKVSEATAQATALAMVPGGRVKAHELEREKGVLIHSFDIEVPGRPGIEEVNVSALDGRIVAMQHEGPTAERLEAKQDRAGKMAAHPGRSTRAHAAHRPAKAKPAARDSARVR